MLRPKSPRRGDDRVSGTDSDRHDDIYRNGSSGIGGNADNAETGDLGHRSAAFGCAHVREHDPYFTLGSLIRLHGPS